MNGQGGWNSSTPDTTLVVTEVGNQGLEVTGGGNNAYFPLPSAIPSGSTGTGFFRVRAGLSWMGSVFYASLGVGFIIFLSWVLGREFPPGLLQEVTNLPWPLR